MTADTLMAAITGTSIAEAQSLGELISGIYVYAQEIIGLAVFCMFLTAGLAYMIPAVKDRVGDPVEIIKNAVIGTILLFSSYIILNSINPALVGNGQGSLVTGSGSVVPLTSEEGGGLTGTGGIVR